MDHLVAFFEFIRPHLNTIALVLTWLGIAIAYLRRRAQWRGKQFLARVNFSLNYVSGDGLAMRTLLETTASEVWLNEYGVARVLAAARRPGGMSTPSEQCYWRHPHSRGHVY